MRWADLSDTRSEWWQEESRAVAVGWAGYAEYRVALDPSPHAEAIAGPISAAEASIAFVLSVLPRALPFFDLEPLHGSSVCAGDGALLLLGPTGAGKSSLAAALDARGYSLLCDDTAAVDSSGVLWPGPPLLNPRWNEARQPIVGMYNRKHIRSPQAHVSEPRRVVALLALAPQPGADVRVRGVSSQDALVHVLANVRSPEALVDRRRSLQLKVAAMLSALPAAVVDFDPRHHAFDLLADAVEVWATDQLS